MDRAASTDLAAYYARRAAEYETIYARPERQEELAGLREAVRGFLAGCDVLEVACGTGYWTAAVAGSARSVLALDCNEEVLALARGKRLPPARVTFRRADAYAPPVPPHACDAGLAAFWWSHVPGARLGEFLRGFRAVLAPDARFIFLDNLYVEGSSTPVSRTDDEGNTYQLRRLADGSRHEVLKNFPAESALRAAVAGLAEEIRVETGRYYWQLTGRFVAPEPAR